MSIDSLVARRERLLGPGNPLFYEEPVHLVRGEGVWLFDADGRRYLDCYNNVPSVGHCHPEVVAALGRQAATLNTHTRYLDETILDYGERLLGKFDRSLDRLAFACTGSEANDLALRIARNATGAEGFICTNATYHGNTTAVSQFSSIYEPVGVRHPAVRMVSWPDTYRADPSHSEEQLARRYADEVGQAIESLHAAGFELAGMLVCPIFANEGLPEVPRGYLSQAADHVRAAGGLFIADEVQAGFGRTGNWWGHEGTGVVPDIVTLGKPMGAGHPISAVIARGDLLDAYRRREMYFNTYAGNPVSCAVGSAVLNVLDDEALIANAATVGTYVLAGFRALQSRHPIIGDVRGRGLFFGLELVSDPIARTPASGAARRIVNLMRDNGVLMSSIGEHGNVLKLRPPLCFSQEHADLLLTTLDDVLTQWAASSER